jgi:hypothetical protein
MLTSLGISRAFVFLQVVCRIGARNGLPSRERKQHKRSGMRRPGHPVTCATDQHFVHPLCVCHSPSALDREMTWMIWFSIHLYSGGARRYRPRFRGPMRRYRGQGLDSRFACLPEHRDGMPEGWEYRLVSVRELALRRKVAGAHKKG